MHRDAMGTKRRLGHESRLPTVAILADQVKSEYQNEILFGASDALREAGTTVVLFAGGELQSPDPLIAQRTAIFDLIGPERVDGVIVLSPVGNQIGPLALAAFCARFAPLPVCSLSVEVPGCGGVLVDDASGMRQLVSHLVGTHQKRRVAFVRGPMGNLEAERRYGVYREVLAQHGATFDENLVVLGDFNAASGWEAVRILCEERV